MCVLLFNKIKYQIASPMRNVNVNVAHVTCLLHAQLKQGITYIMQHACWYNSILHAWIWDILMYVACMHYECPV